MSADTYDLTFKQGETFRRTFTEIVGGDPTDFRDWTVKSQIREREVTSSQLVLNLTPYFTASTDGTALVLTVPATITAAMSGIRTASWDAFLIDPNDPGNARLFLEGRVSCDPATTVTA